MTETGLSLGTPHYMSPEQAIGRAGRRRTEPTSTRSAAVIYEMLAGEPPFTGPTRAGDRRQDAHRGSAAAHRAAAEHPRPGRGSGAHGAGEAAGGPVRQRRRFRAALTADGSRPLSRPGARTSTAGRGRWRAIALAATALAVAATGIALWNWKTNPRAAPPVIRRAEFTMAGQFEVGGAQVAASADGRTIATTDGGQLVVRRVDRLELITVPGSVGAIEPFLSADGTHIGFHRRGELVLQRLDGGEAVTMSFVSGRFPADGGGGSVVAIDSAGLVLLQPQSSRRELLVPAPRGVEFLQPANAT